MIWYGTWNRARGYFHSRLRGGLWALEKIRRDLEVRVRVFTQFIGFPTRENIAIASGRSLPSSFVCPIWDGLTIMIEIVHFGELIDFVNHVKN